MALTEEQRAMLQLLLEGGQGYDDIGSLLGIGGDEVRSRARSALREMGGADPDDRVQLSDFLLGQADPIGRADAVRQLQNDPEANALAQKLVGQLRLIAPRGDLPEIPAAKGAPAQQAAPPPGGAPGSGSGARALPDRLTGAVKGAGSSKRGSQLLVAGGALVLLIVAVVLAVSGVFGGDDDGGSDTTQTTASSNDLVIVKLGPLQGDTGASGQAVFARTQNQPVLQINLSGLEPTGKGQVYVAWLYGSDNAAFPLARDTVSDNGNLTGAAPIPNEIATLVGQLGCVDVSLASSSETVDAIQQAVKGRSLPHLTGTSVLRGQIPVGPGQTAPSGPESQCNVPQATPGGGGQGGGNP